MGTTNETDSRVELPASETLLRNIVKIDRFIADEADLTPKGAEALALIHHYGAVDREALRMAGVLMKGQGLRGSIEPLVKDGWIQEAKVKAKPGEIRQRSVWTVHPDKVTEVQGIMESALRRLQEHQERCHSHLAELATLTIEAPKGPPPPKKPRMSMVLDRNPGMPSTTFVQLTLKPHHEPGKTDGHRAPVLAVKAVGQNSRTYVVKQGQLWNWSDHDLLDAQARSITQTGTAWPDDAISWPLDMLLAEFKRRKIDFEPLTMHQILHQVSSVLDHQVSAMPATARMTTDMKSKVVRVESRPETKSKRTDEKPWEPLMLRSDDFASDITMDDLISIGYWFALYRVKDPSLKRWDLAESRF